jgi:hypothetical protein
MTINLTSHRLSHKRLIGQTLKLFFTRVDDEKNKSILEFKNIACFIDNGEYHNLRSLVICDTAGTFGADMAMQLKRPELEQFKEVFLCAEATTAYYSFRALSEQILWCQIPGANID